MPRWKRVSWHLEVARGGLVDGKEAECSLGPYTLGKLPVCRVSAGFLFPPSKARAKICFHWEVY